MVTPEQELKTTQERIAELEKNHNLLGARVLLSGPVEELELARYVLKATEQMIGLLGRIDEIPRS